MHLCRQNEVICGGLRWFVVVCDGLRWFAMVCGGLSYSHTVFCVRKSSHRPTYTVKLHLYIDDALCRQY